MNLLGGGIACGSVCGVKGLWLGFKGPFEGQVNYVLFRGSALTSILWLPDAVYLYYFSLKVKIFLLADEETRSREVAEMYAFTSVILSFSYF